MLDKYPIVSYFLTWAVLIWTTWAEEMDEVPQNNQINYFKDWNIKKGLMGMMFVLVMCVLMMNSKPPQFNHGFRHWLWEFCTVGTLVYICWLTFLAYQETDSVRQMQKWLDSSLGHDIGKEYHTYDDDCTISWANIWNEMDHYY